MSLANVCLLRILVVILAAQVLIMTIMTKAIDRFAIDRFEIVQTDTVYRLQSQNVRRNRISLIKGGGPRRIARPAIGEQRPVRSGNGSSPGPGIVPLSRSRSASCPDPVPMGKRFVATALSQSHLSRLT